MLIRMFFFRHEFTNYFKIYADRISLIVSSRLIIARILCNTLREICTEYLHEWIEKIIREFVAKKKLRILASQHLR